MLRMLQVSPGRQIIKGYAYLGDALTFSDVFYYMLDYWEWAEDVLIRSHRSLRVTKIYVVYVSLFTYDRIQTSCNLYARLGVLVQVRCSPQLQSYLYHLGSYARLIV